MVAVRPELGGNSVPTPPVLLFNADQQVVGEISNYAAPNEVFNLLTSTLAQNPQYDNPMPDEATAESLELAQIKIDLHDWAGARQILEGIDSNVSMYLQGRLDRFEMNWEGMKAKFAQVDHPQLDVQMVMESAYEHWFAGDYASLEAALQDFPLENDRHAEAMYYYALALHHQGRSSEAAAVLNEHTKYHALVKQTPWVFRMDWAHYDLTGQTLLGRIGYLGNENPEVTSGPQPW